jgi:hypothetical protein
MAAIAAAKERLLTRFLAVFDGLAGRRVRIACTRWAVPC